MEKWPPEPDREILEYYQQAKADAREQGLSLASAVVGFARALDLNGGCAEVVLLARRQFGRNPSPRSRVNSA